MDDDIEYTVLLDKTTPKITIKFNDLTDATSQPKTIPDGYKGLKWRGIAYVHISFMTRNYPNTGYATSCLVQGNSYIAFFVKEASVSARHNAQTFDMISFNACAAWNDGQQLNVTGYRNAIPTSTHTAILLFGKPQVIVLQWEKIDKVTFMSSGGTAHPGSAESRSNVVITEIKIRQLSLPLIRPPIRIPQKFPRLYDSRK